jgi:hypothetical protein
MTMVIEIPPEIPPEIPFMWLRFCSGGVHYLSHTLCIPLSLGRMWNRMPCGWRSLSGDPSAVISLPR